MPRDVRLLQLDASLHPALQRRHAALRWCAPPRLPRRRRARASALPPRLSVGARARSRSDRGAQDPRRPSRVEGVGDALRHGLRRLAAHHLLVRTHPHPHPPPAAAPSSPAIPATKVRDGDGLQPLEERRPRLGVHLRALRGLRVLQSNVADGRFWKRHLGNDALFTMWFLSIGASAMWLGVLGSLVLDPTDTQMRFLMVDGTILLAAMWLMLGAAYPENFNKSTFFGEYSDEQEAPGTPRAPNAARLQLAHLRARRLAARVGARPLRRVRAAARAAAAPARGQRVSEGPILGLLYAYAWNDCGQAVAEVLRTRSLRQQRADPLCKSPGAKPCRAAAQPRAAAASRRRQRSRALTMRVVILPGNGCDDVRNAANWYGWMASRLEKRANSARSSCRTCPTCCALDAPSGCRSC